MNSAGVAIATVLLSLAFWVLYTMAFKEQPDKSITTIIVGFSVLCVLGAKWIGKRWR